MTENITILINMDADNSESLILNYGWTINKILNNVYDIIDNTKRSINHILKIHKSKKRAKNEIERLTTLSGHKGTPEISIFGHLSKFSYIVMSKEPGIDLYDYVDNNGLLDYYEAKKIIKQILEIMSVVHSKNIIHGDIKPENIMYDAYTENISIIDFEGRFTEDFQSPEQIDDKKITKKTDSWSIGILLWYLITENTPFKNENEIKRCKLPKLSSFDDDFSDFIRCTICKNIKIRYSVDELLNHPWLS